MEPIELLTAIGGVAISIIGYFLKSAMDDIKSVKELSYKSSTKIEVLEREYFIKIERLDEKFDLLYNAIEKLTDKLENLKTNEISKRID